MKRSKGWTIFWLIFLFPVGLYRMWAYKQFPKAVRVTITVLLAIGLFGSMTDDEDKVQETTAPVTEEKTEAPKEVKPVSYNIAGISIVKPKVKNANVLSVIDGDTIKVKLDGKEETVRMILVDTPETKHPDKPVQPFGPEASDFTKRELSRKEIGLEFDAQERDQYGRLLAYVWVDDKLFNAILLEKGFARVAVYPPNTKYVDQFRTIQDQARNAKTAIWSIENYATDNGFNDEAAKPKEEPAPVTESKQAPATQPEAEPEQESTPEPAQDVFYKNCDAARAAGAAPIHAGEPGYAKHLDRDGDGIGCDS